MTASKWRFGPFEFDGAAGELRKNGIRIRLQTKPAQMLTALLENSGQLVTRDDLRQHLWPGDTFVDFESSLNSAVKRLRDALSDSADQPKYIETMPRSGYRFVATVEPLPVRLDSVPSIPAPRRNYLLPAAALLMGLLAGLIPWLWPRAGQPRVTFQQITFQRSPIISARFGPDGQTILYTAQTTSGRRVYWNNGVSPESRPLDGLPGSIASVARTGELALLEPSGTTPLAGSVLWRVPMSGGAAREVDRSVMSADWSSGGELALARADEGGYQLEFPRGKVLFRTSGWISHVRAGKAGGRLAFFHHPVRHDDGGSLMTVDLSGTAQTLVKDWAALSGLAWHPDTGELWFTGVKDSGARSLWAVRAGGNPRPVFDAPGSVSLADIGAGGRVLLARESRRLELAAGGEGRPLDEITWHDWSRLQEISPDGSTILFEESGEGAAGRPVTFLYRASTSSAVRVGEGRAMGLAPDGRHVLLLDARDRTRLLVAPLASGTPRVLPSAGVEYQWARFLPGGESVLALANQPGQALRLFRVDLEAGKAVPLTPPTVVRNAAVSPDGASVAILNAEGRLAVYPLAAAGEPRFVPVSEPLAPLLWSGDSLLAQRASAYTEIPARLFEVNLRIGAVKLWREIGPGDGTGVNAITRILVTPDRKHWALNYRRVQAELFVASGLR